MKIYIGSDHAGFELKEILKKHFCAAKEFEDFGTFSNESVDYPDFAHKVAESVVTDPENIGILICGTGNGMAITANKHPNVRAALCWSPEISTLAKQHNNANILVLPARFIDTELAIKTVESFFNAEFEGGRHQNRINKIDLQ